MRSPLIARCRVLESRRVTPSVHHIRVARPADFDFAPVQFCGLELQTDEGGIEYSMSLASSPTRPYLEFGARLSPTPWKQAFASLRLGDEVEADGPYGHFVLDEQRAAVLVAGGIGITPLKGTLEYATDRRLPIDVRLVYSNRSQEEIAYRPELDDLVRVNPRARILHTLTREPDGTAWQGRRGRVDAILLQEAAADLIDPVFYVCGLPGMVADVAQVLRANAVPRSDIRFEQFWGYE